MYICSKVNPTGFDGAYFKITAEEIFQGLQLYEAAFSDHWNIQPTIALQLTFVEIISCSADPFCLELPAPKHGVFCMPNVCCIYALWPFSLYGKPVLEKVGGAL